MNFNAVSTFFTNRETTVNVNPLNSLQRVAPIFKDNLIGRYMTGEITWLTWLVSILILAPLSWWSPLKWALWPRLALGTWFAIGVIGLSLYKQNVYDHYLGFLNPLPYLLLGGLLAYRKKWINVGVAVLAAVLIFINLYNSPLKNPPNKQLERTQTVAKFVIDQAGGQPFNFALIAKSNYDSAYQFYLDMYGHKPKQIPFEITDQLFVVCEDPVCDPVHNPKQEISHFGWSKIEEESELMGVRIYKLIPNPTGVPPE